MNTVGTSLPYFILKKNNIIHESLFFKAQLDRRQTKKKQRILFLVERNSFTICLALISY